VTTFGSDLVLPSSRYVRMAVVGSFETPEETYQSGIFGYIYV
jgi:hypothetical protein